MVRPRTLLVGLFVLWVTAATTAGAAPIRGQDGPPAAWHQDASPAAWHQDAPTAARTATPAQPATDTTVTRVELLPNGSARWTIEIRTRLANDSDVDSYRAFQERFRSDTDRFLAPFRDRMQSVVENAEAATGRKMAATGFVAETSVQEVPRRWGVVSYTFRWSNFSARADGALVVGDVFQGGFYLAADDTLSVVAPDGYAIASTAPDAEGSDRRATWTGRKNFADGRPEVVFEPTATPTATPANPADGGGLPLSWLAGGVVALALLGGGALFVRREQATAVSTGGSSAVLTDAERVERLLADHGGRMRQADVADELGWSASKTSRVLSRMVEDGTAEKLQVGRENVVELAD